MGKQQPSTPDEAEEQERTLAGQVAWRAASIGRAEVKDKAARATEAARVINFIVDGLVVIKKTERE